MEQGPDEGDGPTVEGGEAAAGEGYEARRRAEQAGDGEPEPDPLDEADAQSFPASDPPSGTSPAR